MHGFDDNGMEPADSEGPEEYDENDAPSVDAPVLITDSMLAEEEPAVVDARHGRVDFEKNMATAPPVTLVLMGACVVVFALELAFGSLEDKESIIAAGALVRDLVKQGQLWRLGSAMFLHGGFDHIFGNCVALYILGMTCEHAYGWRRFIMLYFAAGLFGSLLSVQFNPGPSVGASGAIFGLQAAAVVFFYKYRGVFFLRDKRIGFVLLVWGLYQIGIGFFAPFVDNFAHLGGVIAGTAVALRLRPTLVAEVAPR